MATFDKDNGVVTINHDEWYRLKDVAVLLSSPALTADQACKILVKVVGEDITEQVRAWSTIGNVHNLQIRVESKSAKKRPVYAELST